MGIKWNNFKKNDDNIINNHQSQTPESTSSLSSVLGSNSEGKSTPSKLIPVAFAPRKPQYCLDDIILDEDVK